MRSGFFCISVACALAACGDDGSHHLADAPRADAAIDATPADADLMTDPNNCGAIGHACTGCGLSTCAQGVCVSSVLATSQATPTAIAVNQADGSLYWGNDGDFTVMKDPHPGADTPGVFLQNRTAVRGFAFGPAYVYLSRTLFNIVEADGLDGTSGGNLTNAQEVTPTDIFIGPDGQTLYWLDTGNGTIRSAAVGAPVQAGTTLATVPGATHLAAGEAGLYVAAGTAAGAIYRVPYTGGAPTVFADGQVNPGPIVDQGAFILWGVNGDGTAGGASIAGARVDGTELQTFVSGLSPIGDLVLAYGLFWTEPSAGRVVQGVMQTTANNSFTITPKPVAIGESTPSRLAWDTAGCLYFTAPGDGTVRETSQGGSPL